MIDIEKTLKGFGFTFYADGILEPSHLKKQDFVELIEQVWNQAIQTAADNTVQNLQVGFDYEVYVINGSILKLKM